MHERDQEKDFFVSYTSSDRSWAEWITEVLESAGHSTMVQARDFQPGGDWIFQMDTAIKAARRTVAVLSPAYLESAHCGAEWRAAYRKDPTGEKQLLLPVRVAPCDLDGLLGARTYLDLVGRGEAEASDALLAAATGIPQRPAGSGYPAGQRVAFPAGPVAGDPRRPSPVRTHDRYVVPGNRVRIRRWAGTIKRAETGLPFEIMAGQGRTGVVVAVNKRIVTVRWDPQDWSSVRLGILSGASIRLTSFVTTINADWLEAVD